NPQLRFHNAKGFDGTGTPGLININTAPIEVMRILPHWYRLVHETGQAASTLFGAAAVPEDIVDPNAPPTLPPQGHWPLVTDGVALDARLPRVMLPEAAWHYRERFSGGLPLATGIPDGPDYSRR